MRSEVASTLGINARTVSACIWGGLQGGPVCAWPAAADGGLCLPLQATRGVLSADGALAAIATEAGPVQLWDVAPGQPLQVMAGLVGAQRMVCWVVGRVLPRT